MGNISKQAARKFREYWLLQRGSEKGQDQQFWNMLLRDVLGMDDVDLRLKSQVPVPMKGTTKYLDFWIPETKVLIEHKSRDIKLDAPQSGHGGKTPFEQALEYNQQRGYSDKARWIVTCNFDEIWVYDMDRPLDEPQKLLLANLPKELSRLGFLVDSSVTAVRDPEKDVSIKAGRIIGEIYRELLKRYATPDSPETLKYLNRLCVRLVFLFYAEDAELFDKDAFWSLLKNTPATFLRPRLLSLFRALDTPVDRRDPYLEPEIAAFPYTNGGLFKEVADAEIPPLDEAIKALLVKAANFDWREISPTIFGALFESTLNPETRRSGGMVYTSVENIHKVIDPLFLNGLKVELEAIRKERSAAARSAKAREFQARLGGLKFLDPACGSGNFLTETFLSLRKLENEAIKLGARLKEGERLLNLDGEVKVTIDQFKGIEINDFAVAVAKTAMWISEAKMLSETAEILDAPPKYLPLHDYDGIIEGNALKLDWPRAYYIMGNPPFVGHQYRTRDQTSDMDAIYADWKDVNYGKLDYVCAWYKKAVDCAKGARCAFVSTNSICQGESVAAMWQPMFERAGLEIDFAWRTFRWDSEATEKAHVHCVIVGFHCNRELLSLRGDSESRSLGEDTTNLQNSQTPSSESKTIFDGDQVLAAKHINGYLIDAPDIFIENRGGVKMPGFDAMSKGSQPTDGGNLILSPAERDEIVAKWPEAASFTLRYIGADEYINNIYRYCLWLVDVAPNRYRHIAPIMERLARVAEMRRRSPTKSVQRDAEKPMLFTQIRQPKTDYLLIPRHSSERRRYIPIGFVPSNVIVGDAAYYIPNASPYLFGVLISSVHMAWMRVVAGRLKSDYRYTPAVYNNFPWPDLCASAPLREEISKTAQAILDARAQYPDCSLADLYDPLTMPADLRAAHAANDRAVLAAYGLKPDTPEPAIVAHLFARYAEATKGAAGTQGTKKAGESLKSLPSLESLDGAADGGGTRRHGR